VFNKHVTIALFAIAAMFLKIGLT